MLFDTLEELLHYPVVAVEWECLEEFLGEQVEEVVVKSLVCFLQLL